MNLNLTRPIVWFDLETTGVSMANDRIVEIAATKINPDGSKDEYYKLINPTIPIGKGATELHGYSNEDVADCPKFADIADEFHSFILDCDLGGYNIAWFDIPLLVEEFYRCDVPFNYRKVNIIDAFKIYVKEEPRNLAATYERFTGKNLEDAHSAEADISATIEIFEAQIEKYGIDKSVEEISKEYSDSSDNVDFAGKFKKKDKTIIITFGKYKDISVVDIYRRDPNYLSWIADKGEFTQDTKLVAKKLLNKLSGGVR